MSEPRVNHPSMDRVKTPYITLTDAEKRSLEKFLKGHPEIEKLVVGAGYKGQQNEHSIPHGTMVRLAQNAAVPQALMPRDRGGCVALISIENFNKSVHTAKLRNPELNERFLASLGSGPTVENTHCDRLKMDLGKPREEWSGYLGKGIIGVVVDSADKEWDQKYHIAVIVPSLPLAEALTSALAGQTVDELAKHHYLDFLPKVIERNVRKLATQYARTFSLDVKMTPDEMGPRCDCPCSLAELKNFSYDPIVHTEDIEQFICSKILVSSNPKSVLIPVSPHQGLIVARLSHSHSLPFGVASAKYSKPQINNAMQKHYSETAHWGGKSSASPHLPERLSNRTYNVDSIGKFMDHAKVSSHVAHNWISMTYGSQ